MLPKGKTRSWVAGFLRLQDNDYAIGVRLNTLDIKRSHVRRKLG
jgi:hypothetical protein